MELFEQAAREHRPREPVRRLRRDTEQNRRQDEAADQRQFAANAVRRQAGAGARLQRQPGGEDPGVDGDAAGVDAGRLGEVEVVREGAHLLAERGRIEVVAENALTPSSLAAAVDRAASGPAPNKIDLDLDGADKSAQLLVQWVSAFAW